MCIRLKATSLAGSRKQLGFKRWCDEELGLAAESLDFRFQGWNLAGLFWVGIYLTQEEN
jgi:hypothetical protein